jgi:hypothetical protein
MWIIDRRGFDRVMRLFAGGVGGFFFDCVALRNRFWINPPLRYLFRRY